MHDSRSMALMGTHYGMHGGGCCDLPQGNNVIAGVGGGGVVRVLPRTDFTFPLVGSESQTIIIAKYIDTVMWVSGALLVRIYDISAGDATIFVRAQNVSYDAEDPSTVFAGVSGGGDYVASVQVDSGSAGSLVFDALAAPIAAQLRVILDVSMGAGASAGSCTIGVDLVGRPA